MSDSSLEENGAANLEDFEFNPNKRQSEKKRREQAGLEKNRVKKKTSPVFFLVFFWVFWVFYIFAQKREFLGFFQFQEYL
jgi:hypothetical protein